VPVAAKLNVLTERDLVSQVRKYIGASRASVVRRGRKIVLRREVSERCVVIDQAGMYVVGAEGYVECSAKRPLIRRPELARLSGSQIRQRLMRVLG
jgi:hypothetical protein